MTRRKLPKLLHGYRRCLLMPAIAARIPCERPTAQLAPAASQKLSRKALLVTWGKRLFKASRSSGVCTLSSLDRGIRESRYERECM